MIDWITQQYESNDFLVGTTVPFVLAAAGYAGAKLWRVIYDAGRRAVTVRIRLNSDKPFYDEFCEAVTDKVIVPWSRQSAILSYDYERKCAYSGVGYGRNFGILHGTPVLVEREVVESHSRDFKEYTSLTAFTLNKSGFVRNISNLYDKSADRLQDDDSLIIYKAAPYLEKMFQKKKREWHSLDLPEGFVSALSQHMSAITKPREETVFTGNHTLGILLHGAPGTGKSSIAHALASHLSKNMVYYAGNGNISDVRINSTNDLLLLEDVDPSSILCGTGDRTSQGNNDEDASPMSDVLNYLDGPLTPPNLTVIATTNRLDDLDPAFIRPGRFSIIVNTDKMQVTAPNS